MVEGIHGIIIDNILVPVDEIENYCNDKIEQTKKPKWERDIFQFIKQFFNKDETVVQYTSGTSGESKKLLLDKKTMIHSAKQTLNFLQIPPASNALLCLPVEFIAGKMMIVRAIVGQLNLLFAEPSSIPSITSKHDIKLCSMVPMQAFNIFSNYELLKYLDTLLIGGAEIRPELEELLQTIPVKVYETFGMAETCSHIALRRINGDEPEDKFTVLPGIKISRDERHCLVIKSDCFDKEIVTNDIIEQISGTQFKWKGRFDNLINTGGKKIHPEVLENQLEHQLFFPVAVIGVKHAELGNKIVLVVEKKYCGNKNELMNKLKDILPTHHVPKDIFIVDSIPLNKSFKVDRIKLTEMIKSHNI